MRTQTRHSLQMWIAASRSGRAYAELKLRQLRARSPITAPTSRDWKRLMRAVDLARAAYDFAAHPAVFLPSLLLGGIGIYLIRTYL